MIYPGMTAPKYRPGISSYSTSPRVAMFVDLAVPLAGMNSGRLQPLSFQGRTRNTKYSTADRHVCADGYTKKQ